MERSFIIKKAYLKLVLASVKVVPYDPNKLEKHEIEVPMQHRSEYLAYPDDKEWEDTEYNYRLNTVDEVFYAIKNNKVVGHIGLDENDIIRAVYVDPGHRRQGISEKLHTEVFKVKPRVISDDANAMEPEEKKLWEKLVKKMPDNVKKEKDGTYIYQF